MAAVFIAAMTRLLCAQSNGADALLGPLPIRDQFLLNNGFFFFIPEQSRVLPAGESAVSLTATDSNTFAKSAWITTSLAGQTSRARAVDTLANSRFHSDGPLFLVDGETHRLELSMRHGFGDQFELGVAIPISTIGGGWSDALIEVTHQSLGLGNDERESLRRNSETVYFRAGSHQYLRDRSVGYALGDIALSGKYELAALEERAVAISISGAIELPTGNASTLDGSGSIDGGMQIMAARDFTKGRIEGSLGLLRLGGNRPLGTGPQILITDTVAVSRLMTDRTAGTVQLTVSESPFRQIGIAEFTRRSYQLSAGIRHRMGRSVVAYAALIENLFNYENSADAGLAWGLTKRF